MLFLGVEVGGNELVVRYLGTIGLTAVLLGAGTVGGTLVAAKVVWRYGFRSVAPKAAGDSGSTHAAMQEADKASTGGGSRFSLVIVGTFAAGVALGGTTPAAEWVGVWPLTMWALYLLMLAVGITIGSDAATLQSLVRQPRRTLWVPAATILGSWAGVSAVWGVLRLVGVGRGLGWAEAMAVGSGQGYYSLSGVLLGEMCGPEIGTVALLANIVREMLTVVGAGWMVRRFSPLGPICSGGATAMDVSLPGILRHCGPQYLAVALFQAVIADLSVPFIVPFFAGMAT